MSAQWTAEIVGKMHLNCISQTQIATKMSCSREYVNAVLNGRRNPKNAESVFREALENVLSEKNLAHSITQPLPNKTDSEERR